MFFLLCMKPMTPVILNSGNHAPSEAHFDSEFGVKFGLAGISGGRTGFAEYVHIVDYSCKVRRSIHLEGYPHVDSV